MNTQLQLHGIFQRYLEEIYYLLYLKIGDFCKIMEEILYFLRYATAISLPTPLPEIFVKVCPGFH